MSGPQLNDKEVLAKIFFPNQPKEVAILPYTNGLPIAGSAIAFGKKPALVGFHCHSFGYINNPDGTVRWLYPLGNRQAPFLRLYSGAGLRSNALKAGFKTAFSFGLESWVRSGILHVFFKDEKPLDGMLGLFNSENLAIFTGTRGENRKAVFLLENEKGNHWFCKLPLTEAAQALVANEQKTLTEIADLKLQKMVVPMAKPFGSGLMVSDVKPAKAKSSNELLPLHFEALAELSDLSLELQPLADYYFLREIRQHLNELIEQPIHPDFDFETVQRVIANLQGLSGKLDANRLVPTTLAHGDFTPWNMYLSHEKLHVFDWELSERLPMLYDAFHFVFQTGVLVKKLPATAIHEAVFSMKNHPKFTPLLEQQPTSFDFLYQLYLLRNISYYLLKYLRQDALHMQAHWQLAAWDSALTYFLNLD
ncbi:MAG: phosphotransferase [Saprospiraceae bacterium]|nr:phosphotransferase [Saprospiraceae bacterium]